MAYNNYKLIKHTASKTPGEWGQVDIHDKGIEMISTLYLSDDEFKFWNTYLKLYNNLFDTKEQNELFKFPDFIKETYHLIGPIDSNNRRNQAIGNRFYENSVTAYFKISPVSFTTNALDDGKFNYCSLRLLDSYRTTDIFMNKFFNGVSELYEEFMLNKPDGYFIYRPFYNSPDEAQGLNLYLFNMPINIISEYRLDYDNYVSYIEKTGALYYMKLIDYLKSHYDLGSINLNDCTLTGLFRHNKLESDFDQISFRKVISYKPVKTEKIDKIK